MNNTPYGQSVEERLIRLETRIEQDLTNLTKLVSEVKEETRQITQLNIAYSKLDSKTSSAHKRLDDMHSRLEDMDKRVSESERSVSRHDEKAKTNQFIQWSIVGGLISFFFWFIREFGK